MGASYRKTIGISGAFCVMFFIACAPLAARAALDYMPRLAPTSGWLIGQAALSDSADARGAPLPCVAFNQFENGFTVRLSGGGGRIAALAIDFRQNAFGRGERYPVRISIDHAYASDFEGAAFDRGTLVIDTLGDENLYKALQRGEIMIVGLGGNVAAFDLKGLSDGLERLESCYRPDSTLRQAQMQPQAIQQPRADARSEQQTPEFPGLRMIGGTESPPASPARQDAAVAPDAAPGQPPLESPPPASSEDQLPLRIDAALDLAAQPIENTQADASAAQDANASVPPLWTAQKGEDIRTVLSRWSRQAGVNLVWTAKQAGTIENDFRFDGAFEDAVHAFLAQSGKGMSARLQGKTSTPDGKDSDNAPIPLSPRADEIAPLPRGFELIVPASEKNSVPPRTETVQAGAQDSWTAAAGEDLRDALAQWSRRAGVDLVWESPAIFSVPVDIRVGNSYESAVEEILKRSATGTLRPVGELRRDPGSGRSALVIRVEGNS